MSYTFLLLCYITCTLPYILLLCPEITQLIIILSIILKQPQLVLVLLNQTTKAHCHSPLWPLTHY
jgi:hypothetical protein